jgi:hypothetical protein
MAGKHRKPSRLRLRSVIVAAACSLLGVVVPSAPAYAAPTVSVSPVCLADGNSTVIVSGSGYPAPDATHNSEVEIWVRDYPADTSRPMRQITANSGVMTDGAFWISTSGRGFAQDMYEVLVWNSFYDPNPGPRIRPGGFRPRASAPTPPTRTPDATTVMLVGCPYIDEVDQVQQSRMDAGLFPYGWDFYDNRVESNPVALAFDGVTYATDAGSPYQHRFYTPSWKPTSTVSCGDHVLNLSQASSRGAGTLSVDHPLRVLCPSMTLTPPRRADNGASRSYTITGSEFSKRALVALFVDGVYVSSTPTNDSNTVTIPYDAHLSCATHTFWLQEYYYQSEGPTIPPAAPNPDSAHASASTLVSCPSLTLTPNTLLDKSQPLTVTATGAGFDQLAKDMRLSVLGGGQLAAGSANDTGTSVMTFRLKAARCGSYKLVMREHDVSPQPQAVATLRIRCSPIKKPPKDPPVVKPKVYKPSILLAPFVVKTGYIATVTGKGYRPNAVVDVVFRDGGAAVAERFTVTCDATGAFRRELLFLQHAPLGVRQLTGTDVAHVSEVGASVGLVVAGTFQPGRRNSFVQRR